MKLSFRQKRGQRLAWLFIIVSGFVFIILGVLRENIVFFMLPSEYLQQKDSHKLKVGQFVRLGGKVAKGSIKKHAQFLTFQLTDENTVLNVSYEGPIPDLFREQQGVVIEGRFEPQATVFKATKLFAKHDENYIPREVVNNLKNKNMWYVK